MAAEHQCSEKSVRNALEDVRMKSDGLSRKFLSTGAGTNERRDCCKATLNLLKAKGPVKFLIYERFPELAAANSRNHRVITSVEVPVSLGRHSGLSIPPQ